MKLTTEIHILASPEEVWRVLTDFPSYGEWNPFIRSIEGPLSVGSRIRARIEPPGGKGMTFRPKVLEVNPPHSFRWLGHLFVPRLFDGEHSFGIEQLEEEQVRFTQSERFRGVLVPLLRRTLEENTRAGFEQMNAALKERAERSA